MGKSSEPQILEVKGKSLRCPICNNRFFHKRRAQLNTPMASFFNLDWANKTATCYVCSECSNIS